MRLLLTFVVTLTLGIGLALWAPFSPATIDCAPESHLVQPGDTLWSIAREHCPGYDTREVVYQLEQELTRAGRPANQIYPGQLIPLP
mgnify:FL=1